MFGLSLPPFVCGRAHVLFVFVAHSGVQHVLTVYMGNTASVLKEAETVYTLPTSQHGTKNVKTHSRTTQKTKIMISTDPTKKNEGELGCS
jgi:hypothetical protein